MNFEPSSVVQNYENIFLTVEVKSENYIQAEIFEDFGMSNDVFLFDSG